MGNFLLEDGIKIKLDKERKMEKDFNLYLKNTIIKDSSWMERKMGQGR